MSRGELKKPYIAIMKNGKMSYGGSQEWWKRKIIFGYGCGVIAATDTLLYLDFHQECEKENGILDFTTYQKCVEKMQKSYFPVFPYLGIPAWLLGIEMNRYFRKNKIPLQSIFGVTRKKMAGRIKEMLACDIPVILAIGPNFPFPIKRHKVDFYEKQKEGYEKIAEVAAHFVVVTGFEGQWLRISSWGKEYYINYHEYQNYVKKYSCSFVSNICYIRKTKEWKCKKSFRNKSS